MYYGVLEKFFRFSPPKRYGYICMYITTGYGKRKSLLLIDTFMGEESKFCVLDDFSKFTAALNPLRV